MKRAKIKTIDVHGKEWFDKANGNSYHAVRVTLNEGQKSESVLVAPFQYGYGDCYVNTAFELVKAYNGEKPSGNGVLWAWCRENKVALRYHKQENCGRKQVEAFGKGAE